MLQNMYNFTLIMDLIDLSYLSNMAVYFKKNGSNYKIVLHS